mgnify:FL=1
MLASRGENRQARRAGAVRRLQTGRLSPGSSLQGARPAAANGHRRPRSAGQDAKPIHLADARSSAPRRLSHTERRRHQLREACRRGTNTPAATGADRAAARNERADLDRRRGRIRALPPVLEVSRSRPGLHHPVARATRLGDVLEHRFGRRDDCVRGAEPVFFRRRRTADDFCTKRRKSSR